MTKDNLRQTANLLSVLLALIVNILATALPLNNQTTGQISDRFKYFLSQPDMSLPFGASSTSVGLHSQSINFCLRKRKVRACAAWDIYLR